MFWGRVQPPPSYYSFLSQSSSDSSLQDQGSLWTVEAVAAPGLATEGIEEWIVK